MQDGIPISTLLVIKHNLSISQSPISEAEKQAYKEYAGHIHYLSLVRSLLFATQTWPDIQFAVNLIAQFGSNPGIAHLEAAKHILHYLKGIMDFGLVLERQTKGSFDLVGWTDSNWAQDPNDHYLVGEFIFDIAGGSISWSSKKQPIITTSSVEAEYIASASTTKEAVWLHILLEELDFPQATATIINVDNQSCIVLAHNPVSHSHTKHINIQHHFIQEHIKQGEVSFQYISTKEMLADIFTKTLPHEAFIKF